MNGEKRDKTDLDDLERKGWSKQFIASEPRLGEAVQMYIEAGFEVHLEPLPKVPDSETCSREESEGGGECRMCFQGFEDRYKIIYTRPGKNKNRDSEDGLF